jgi:hypothetical protein
VAGGGIQRCAERRAERAGKGWWGRMQSSGAARLCLTHGCGIETRARLWERAERGVERSAVQSALHAESGVVRPRPGAWLGGGGPCEDVAGSGARLVGRGDAEAREHGNESAKGRENRSRTRRGTCLGKWGRAAAVRAERVPQRDAGREVVRARGRGSRWYTGTPARRGGSGSFFDDGDAHVSMTAVVIFR